MAFHDPLGFAGGASRVHDDPDVIGIDRHGRFFGACVSQGLFVGDEAG